MSQTMEEKHEFNHLEEYFRAMHKAYFHFLLVFGRLV